MVLKDVGPFLKLQFPKKIGNSISFFPKNLVSHILGFLDKLDFRKETPWFSP
jgi:hypothetical protein